jgi:hypothetical protein
MNMDSMGEALKECLSTLNLENESGRIVEKVKSANLFLGAHKPSNLRPYHLGSQYHRLKYIEQSMPFIAPVSIVFNPDAPKSKHCVGQYVPIKSTVKQMLNDPTYREQVCWSEKCTCIAGLSSGTCYKSNSFFRDNPTAVPLLLYSDGLCITNPLNANAAKKNKLIGVYMTLGSVASWNRSRVDSTQLVMVLNEQHLKQFGPQVVYKQLLEDLKGSVLH